MEKIQAQTGVPKPYTGPVPVPENIKKEKSDVVNIQVDMGITPLGQRRLIWDKNNPIQNLEGGYFHIGQTQEEYIENIPEVGYLFDGTKCKHPLQEQLYSRCLSCNDLVPMIKRVRKPIIEEKPKK
jgi:hypothetical protein